MPATATRGARWDGDGEHRQAHAVGSWVNYVNGVLYTFVAQHRNVLYIISAQKHATHVGCAIPPTTYTKDRRSAVDCCSRARPSLSLHLPQEILADSLAFTSSRHLSSLLVAEALSHFVPLRYLINLLACACACRYQEATTEERTPCHAASVVVCLRCNG